MFTGRNGWTQQQKLNPVNVNFNEAAIALRDAITEGNESRYIEQNIWYSLHIVMGLPKGAVQYLAHPNDTVGTSAGYASNRILEEWLKDYLGKFLVRPRLPLVGCSSIL